MTEPVHVLVTGGCGFVLAAGARDILRTYPTAYVTVADRAVPSPLVRDFFAAYADRVCFVQMDVADSGSLPDVDATHVVHGAALTLDHRRERGSVRECVDINIRGTVNLLEWASHRSVRRFVYVSTGAVYGLATRWSPAGTQDEDGPFNPAELYGLTKYTAERIALRYGVTHPLDVRSVRLSAVFGPMERPTGARGTMSLVYRAMRAHVEDRPLLLTARSLRAAVDLVSSEDVGTALSALLVAENLTRDAFNVADGALTPVADVLVHLAGLLPGLRWTTDEDRFDVDLDPTDVRARYAAYAIDRIAAEVGWRPRPLLEQLRSYVDWVAADPEKRCPPYATDVEQAHAG